MPATILPNKPVIEPNRGGVEYIINSMLLFAIIGISIKVFFGNVTSPDGSYGRANATIWGYGLVSIAILAVMFISYAVHDKIMRIEKKGVTGIIDFLKSFLSSSLPSVLTVIILLWIITLNAFYYTRINKGQVAKEYYQLSAGTSLLFLFQIICLFQLLKLYINGKTKTDVSNDNVITQSRISIATYFITAINLVVAGMMTIILQFFSTDG
jgi:hypothetical protein